MEETKVTLEVKDKKIESFTVERPNLSEEGGPNKIELKRRDDGNYELQSYENNRPVNPKPIVLNEAQAMIEIAKRSDAEPAKFPDVKKALEEQTENPTIDKILDAKEAAIQFKKSMGKADIGEGFKKFDIEHDSKSDNRYAAADVAPGTRGRGDA